MNTVEVNEMPDMLSTELQDVLEQLLLPLKGHETLSTSAMMSQYALAKSFFHFNA